MDRMKWKGVMDLYLGLYCILCVLCGDAGLREGIDPGVRTSWCVAIVL